MYFVVHTTSFVVNNCKMKSYFSQSNQFTFGEKCNQKQAKHHKFGDHLIWKNTFLVI